MAFPQRFLDELVDRSDILDVVSSYVAGASKKGSITYVNTPEEALQDANICFVFTEWEHPAEAPGGLLPGGRGRQQRD